MSWLQLDLRVKRILVLLLIPPIKKKEEKEVDLYIFVCAVIDDDFKALRRGIAS